MLRRAGLLGEFRERGVKGGAGYAFFGDDGGDEFGWCYVEGGCGGNIRGHADAGYVRYFFLRALFDGDVFARGNCEIERRGDGRGD